VKARRVVVVGAGLAGSRCAQALRAEGFDGAITVLGEERHLPYERPALSKEFLAGARGELALRPERHWRDQDIRLRLGRPAESIDVASRTVRAGGLELGWDALVLATGARSRRLQGLGGDGVYALRTLDDAIRLRRELLPGRRLVIAGAGFVGTEVASTALRLGLEVTLTDPGRVPFERVLGAELGALLADRYRTHGVRLRLGTQVARLNRTPSGSLWAAVLADGTVLACDLLLVAVGADPAGELLGRDAVPTDLLGRTALPGVYACGDVAATWHAGVGRHVRLGHWASAATQAAVVARAILGHEAGPVPPPYFWSDQFGFRLQHVGAPADWHRVIIADRGDSIEARYLDAADRLLAALLVNGSAAAVSQLRREVAAEALAA
jgi:NADPH-dependent 2,4-dienoyl-CoA reductase/sulfur reductase-like enzyme